MKKCFLKTLTPCLAALMLSSAIADQVGSNLIISRPLPHPGNTAPIWVSLSGFSGEGLAVLKFDLYVQGFGFTNAVAAQYQISGSDTGDLTGTLTDRVSGKPLFARSYSGTGLRRQAHYFANDIVQTVLQTPGIGLTKIAFKRELTTEPGKVLREIYVADFDGHDAVAVTHDQTIVAAPCWVPGRLALYYTSYYPGNPDIFYHSLSTGQRSIVAKYSGLNTAPAASPDGARLAMVLSRSGSPNIWVANADGSDAKKLTSNSEDSSPCWSPDGQWICFATKLSERRVLAKVPAGGGVTQEIPNGGHPSPSEPDWSPDGKWIAFTQQRSSGFDICVVPAGGGDALVLVAGEDPSWSPNSRTLVFTRRTAGHNYALSVLDVMTKQVKDIQRTAGNDSQPAWAR
jgi:TolB protein